MLTIDGYRRSPMAKFVLVHGGGHGGWCFQPLARVLRDNGHEDIRPDVDGFGRAAHLFRAGVDLDCHVNDIVALLHYEDLRDTILVGHSYGGMVITGAADRATEPRGPSGLPRCHGPQGRPVVGRRRRPVHGGGASQTAGSSTAWRCACSRARKRCKFYGVVDPLTLGLDARTPHTASLEVFRAASATDEFGCTSISPAVRISVQRHSCRCATSTACGPNGTAGLGHRHRPRHDDHRTHKVAELLERVARLSARSMTPVAPTPWVARPRRTSALGASETTTKNSSTPLLTSARVFDTYARIVHEQHDLPLSLGVPHACIILRTDGVGVISCQALFNGMPGAPGACPAAMAFTTVPQVGITSRCSSTAT